MRIFLVEDSPAVSAQLTELLDDLPGAELVGHAADAPTAITGIAALAPDVAILDLSLKAGTGFDVLKSLPALSPRPVAIMFTNYASPPVRRFATRNGADYFYDKAGDVRALLDTLDSLSRQHTPAAVAPSL
jgi:DNA-binding NarL/FixJ family response regulator